MDPEDFDDDDFDSDDDESGEDSDAVSALQQIHDLAARHPGVTCGGY